MFISNKIDLYELIFPKENKWTISIKLLQTNKIMAATKENSDKSNNRDINNWKRIEELKNFIFYFKNILNEFEFPIKKYDEKKYLNEINSKINYSILGDKEEEIKKIYNLLNENNNYLKKLIDNRIRLLEHLHSLKCIKEYFPDMLENFKDETRNFQLSYFLGTIPSKNIDRINKLFFRLTKNNIISKFLPLNINYSKDLLKKYEDKIVSKNLFLMVIPLENEKLINNIKKIIDSFEGNILNFLEQKDFSELKDQLKIEIKDNKDLIKETKFSIKKTLWHLSEPNLISNIGYISELEMIIIREELILKLSENFIIRDENLLSLKFWIIKENYKEVLETINSKEWEKENFTKPELIKIKNNKILKEYIKPTYHLTNENSVSKHFQNIVDTYGVPNYNEINPGIFTVISFSFCFGIMFGDFGHGSLIVFFSLFLFTLKKNNILFDFRYLFLLLGIFSTYCGLIYNEFFSVSLPLFKSGYDIYGRNVQKNNTYPLGFDWIWFESSNEITFFNSFKMKFSIIFGVIHMIFGIILKGANSINNKNYLDFFFEFLPQLVFMYCTFGYMSFCIIYKWLQNWIVKKPPSIIEIFTSFISVNEKTLLFNNIQTQSTIQFILIILCLISIFIMLIPKPLILILRNNGLNKNKAKNDKISKKIIQDLSIGDEKSVNEELIYENNDLEIENKEEVKVDNSEIIVHQLIETIEFILGAISNTASYLRLWALSLAHGQLSKVFLELVLSFSYTNRDSIIVSVISMIIVFPLFFIITLGVLLCMDLMECFLHALRLHWVEFQNKFFKGNGLKYEPFIFKFN